MICDADVDRIVERGRALAATADLAAVRAWVVRRLDGEDDPAALDADEVVLACACATGHAAALAAFERRYCDGLPAALRRLALDADDVAEVLQRLRVRLFVAEGDAPPRVVGYAGGGQLGGLVRVAAIRIALNLLRARGRVAGADLEDIPIVADDPELARLKARSRAQFKQAFEDAIVGLDPRERSLLNLAIVKRLGIDKIALVYGVHRATAARWIAQARANLGRAVHALLRQRLGVPRDHVDALMPLVESQLELSLERLLRSRAES